MSIIFK